MQGDEFTSGGKASGVFLFIMFNIAEATHINPGHLV